MKKFLLFSVALLMAALTMGQTAAQYSFLASSGTYTALSGATTVTVSGTADEGNYNGIPLGFNFTFCGTVYTQINVSTNGWCTLGTSGTPNTISSPGLSNSFTSLYNSPTIAPLWDDEALTTPTGISYISASGSAGDRITTIQWSAVKWIYNAASGVIEFQIKFYENGNKIDFVYHQLATAVNLGSASIGIANASGSYLSLNNSGTNPTASSTTNTTTISTKPAEGQTYTFTPPPPCSTPAAQPTVLNLTPGATIINGSFTAASGADDYLVIRSISASLLATPINGTRYSVGTALGGGTVDYYGTLTNFTSTGLSLSTLYYFFIFSANDATCAGGPLYLTTAPLSLSATTNNAITTYTWNQTGTASYAIGTNWTPTRTTPDPSDMLIFDNSATTTATDVPTQTVRRISILNSTTVNLQAAATATLTIASDGTATDELSVATGSTLMSNGTTAALTITYSGTGSTGNIAGTMEETCPSGTLVHAFALTGGTSSVTTVSGTLANGQSGGTGVCTITGSTTALVFTSTGIYNHKFTTSYGTIPTATWNIGSTVKILGYTSPAAGNYPTGITQTFSNFEWNCPSQSTAPNLSGSTITANGTFTMTSTGSSELRLGSGTSGNIVCGNFLQTGGTINCAAGTGTGTIKASGTFNQTAGTITESSTGLGVIEFNGVSNQSVTFGGALSNTLNYRVNNNAGITLTGTMAITTGASLIISSTAATPISGGTLTYTGTTTLVYNSTTGNQTATSNEFPAASGPTNLTINAPNIIVTIPFDRTISGTLTMTAGNVNMGANTLTLGTSVAAMGTLTYTAGGIIGNFKRWVSAATGPKEYPVGIAFIARKATINFTVAPAPGGTLTASFIPTDPGTTGLPLFQDAITVNTAAKDGYWKIDAGDGLTGGTYTASFIATSFPGVNSYTGLVLIKRPSGGGSWVLDGIHVTTTGSNAAPVLSRTGMTGFSEFGVGGDAANNPMSGTNIFSIATGNWGDGTTWNTGTVPTSADYVTVMAGHIVTTAGGTPPYACNNLTIAVTGNLTVSGNDIAIGGILTNNGTFNSSGGTTTITGGAATGITNAATTGTFIVSGGIVTLGPAGGGKTTFTNNGTLTVSSTGTLNINGNLYTASGSIFNQSGGNINIDGNAAGVAANSSTTYLLYLNAAVNWTGGTLTIIDPSAAASSTYSIYYTPSTNVNVPIDHTLRFGDGISSDPGGNAAGFGANIYVGSGKLNFGNCIVNGPGTGTASATNRMLANLVYPQGIIGNLVINSNGEINTSTTIYVGGNLTVNTGGTLTSNSGAVVFCLPQGTSYVVNPNAQQITNNGTIRNLSASPTANFYTLTINNSSTGGVTLNSPLSVSSTLNLTQGFVNTTAANLLTLGTASVAGTLSGGSATAYIVGPFARTFAASRVTTGTYSSTTLYPVGKSGTYLPLWIDPNTSVAGPVVFTGEAFTTNSGSPAAGVTNLSSKRWEALVASGGANLTNSFLQISDAGIVPGNQILQATSAAGTYGAIPVSSTYTAGPPITLTTGSAIPSASFNGYFAYGDLTPCIAPDAQPTAFVVTFKTSTGFVGSFTAASPAPSNYLVVRYPSGSAVTNPVDYTAYTVGVALGLGTVRSVSNATTFTETGLTAGLTYDYYVYSYNNSGCYGPVYLTTSPLTATVTTCAAAVGAPGTPTSSLVTNTGFTASWTASGTSGVNYLLDVATDAAFITFVSPYNGYDVGLDVLSQSIIGLSAATTYYVRVRAVDLPNSCYSAYSGTLTQATACNPISSFPWNEGFEGLVTVGANILPQCWAHTNISSSMYSCNGTCNSNTAHTGTKFIGGSYSFDVWNFTPGMQLTAGVSYDFSYWFKCTDITVGYAVNLAYGSAQNVASMTNVLNTETGLNIAVWTQRTFTFTPASSGVYYFGLHTSAPYDPNGIAYDDFKLDLSPSCPAPSALTATDITSTTANLSWTPGGTETAWEYVYGVSPLAPPAGSGTATASNTINPISGLTANTTYQYYVRANCGGTFSTWAGPMSFFTGYCTPAPSSVDGNGITNVTFSTVNNTPPVLPVPGNYGNYSAMIGDIQKTATIPVAITFQTGYTYDTKIWIDWNDNLVFTDLGEEVYSGTSLSDNPTTLIASFVVPGTVTLGNHRMRIGGVDIGPPTPCYTGTYGSYQDYTVNVIAAPTCPAPSALTVTDINATSANLSWTPGGTETAWEYVYGVSPLAPPAGSGTATASNTINPISGLTANTTYQYYVRANCGGTFSTWTGPYNFSTPCESVAILPWSEGWETGYTDQTTIAGCWTQEQTGSYFWVANSSMTTYNRTPRTGLFNATLHYNGDAWLFKQFTLDLSKTYRFSVYARQDMTVETTIEVKYGTTNTSAGMTTTIIPSTAIINGDYQLLTGIFTVPANGNYYIGVHGIMGGTPWYISIDDLSLEELGPLPAVFNVTGTGSYCSGGVTGLTVTLSGSEVSVNYQLYKNSVAEGSPIPGTGSALTWTNKTEGTYTVTGTNGSGTTPMNGSAVISTDPLSVGGSIAPATTTITLGQSTGTLTLSGHTGTIVKWQKHLDGGSWTDIINTTTTYSETPAAIGTWEYRAEVQSGNCVAVNSAAATVIVNSAVPVDLEIDGTVTGTVCYNATNIITVALNAPFTVQSGGNVEMIAGVAILYMPGTTVQSGGYMWGHIAPNGPWCLPIQAPAIVTVSTGIEEVSKQSFFKVYPNPTTGSFTLELSEVSETSVVKVEIYGMRGEKMLNDQFTGEKKHEFSLESKPTGIYFIRVFCGDNLGSQKIIKQ